MLTFKIFENKFTWKLELSWGGSVDSATTCSLFCNYTVLRRLPAGRKGPAVPGKWISHTEPVLQRQQIRKEIENLQTI